MANTTVGFGVVLIVLGIVGYIATGAASITALIPAIIGLLLLTFGIIARNENMRKHAMHAAAVVGLLGFIGSVGGIWKVFRMMGGEAIDRPEAAIAQSIMAVICLAFVALTVKSFVSARVLKKTE
ncbi:MAG: hypothetical protein KF749_07555 [Bacteroidetes bacterium]|nr:hypothetical protein [Bacteroidota bacterium]MCW5896841.1 hypothetical protein [Bacteroidota bacterium]